MTKNIEAIKTVNDLTKDRPDADVESIDAPPLDFSFKNIKHISCTSFPTQKSRIFNPGKEKKRRLLTRRRRAS